jgi:16S rRNA (guanine527-N7)-methyltransferase
MRSSDPATGLSRGLHALGLELDRTARERLLAYIELLHKWNRVYNLTAVRDPASMVPRHLLDSLALLPYVHGSRLLDVGTGAGLPAVPLVIADPRLQVTALDSVLKKTRFVTQARLELGLGNLEVAHSRVEAYRPEVLFDCVCSRAFASLEDFVAASGRLCATHGRLLAMRGRKEPETRLPAGFRQVAEHLLRVPGLEATRRVIEIAPVVEL